MPIERQRIYFNKNERLTMEQYKTPWEIDIIKWFKIYLLDKIFFLSSRACLMVSWACRKIKDLCDTKDFSTTVEMT